MRCKTGPVLLLDDFEHAAAAADLVSELLASCPQLQMLVTSRSPLNLRVEQEFPVAPLTLPAATPGASVHQLAANPAVELFLRRARAQAVTPEFALTAANAAAVAGICRSLEGLPLALELAAARSRVLPPRAMLGRLEHRLAFLVGGAPGAPATRPRASAPCERPSPGATTCSSRGTARPRPRTGPPR